MKPDYGRTTITVPFELKKRMKKMRGQVNWSAVACEAFENKLEELGPVEEIHFDRRYGQANESDRPGAGPMERRQRRRKNRLESIGR